jgi:NAD(P)-dependent dehydrogenase (short-subunit alcohol dehydrogenase family)
VGLSLVSQFTGVEDTPENRQKFISNVPMGRIGEVDDVSSTAVFLASNEAKFITGVNLEVDGGRSI